MNLRRNGLPQRLSQIRPGKTRELTTQYVLIRCKLSDRSVARNTYRPIEPEKNSTIPDTKSARIQVYLYWNFCRSPTISIFAYANGQKNYCMYVMTCLSHQSQNRAALRSGPNSKTKSSRLNLRRRPKGTTETH
jgi:hypothetical protein